MLHDNALVDKVQQLLTSELQAVGDLYALLQAETTALQNPDTASLASVVKRKTVPLDALAESQRARYAILQDLQQPASEESWRELLAQLDAQRGNTTSTLTPQLDQLINKLALCRTVNRVNEKIVSRSQHSVRHLLNILRGHVPDNKLYGASGATISITDAKPISAA